MTTIAQITEYIERENKRDLRWDDFKSWVLDGIGQKLDNSSARLLMSYLDDECSAKEVILNALKLREMILDLMQREYGERAGSNER